MKKISHEMQIHMRDAIVSWAGEQGFFPTDEQIADLLAKLSDKNFEAGQKGVNALLNMIANKDVVVEKLNEFWPFIESHIRLLQGALIRPMEKTDPKDILTSFSKDQTKKEKGNGSV